MFGRAVTRVVVYKDGFPVDSIKQLIEPFDPRADIVALIERPNDNGEFQPGLSWRSQ
jgi:hypothetical protein